MKHTGAAILTSLLLWSATALSAQRVQTNYDHRANSSTYKTYSWLETNSASLSNQHLKDVVNYSLAAKGLTQVPSGGDLTIFASDMSEGHQKLVATCNETDGGWGGGGFGGGPFCAASTTTTTYKVETLAVEIFAGNSNTLLWRASSTYTLRDDSDTTNKSLNRNVERLFTHFPPDSKDDDQRNMPSTSLASRPSDPQAGPLR